MAAPIIMNTEYQTYIHYVVDFSLFLIVFALAELLLSHRFLYIDPLPSCSCKNYSTIDKAIANRFTDWQSHTNVSFGECC